MEPKFEQDIPAQLARSDWLEENGRPAEAERLRVVCQLRQVLVAIGTGKFDQDLADIAAMVLTRQLRLRQPGRRVVFNSRATPSYLVGIQGTIFAHRAHRTSRASVGVRLDRPVGRFSSGVWVPINCLDFIV